MRVVIVGATGNVGTSLVSALARDDDVTEVLGVARRIPSWTVPKVRWVAADITHADLCPRLRGADAVVHLAWRVQPAHDPSTLRTVNVEGGRRVFEAAARAGVPAVVHVSSFGVYAPGPKDRLVDESWPVSGVATSFYSRHKVDVERLLDGFEQDHPGVRVVRMRPVLVLKREAASEVLRLFLGPLLSPALRRGVFAVPDVTGLRFQAVHADDVAEACRLALHLPVAGPFNLAAEPVLDVAALARMLGARRVRVPPELLRRAVALSWRLHLQPTPSGWLDMVMGAPLLSAARARMELGWRPRHSAEQALSELVGGLRDGAGLATPPLEPGAPTRPRPSDLLAGATRVLRRR